MYLQRAIFRKTVKSGTHIERLAIFRLINGIKLLQNETRRDDSSPKKQKPRAQFQKCRRTPHGDAQPSTNSEYYSPRGQPHIHPLVFIYVTTSSTEVVNKN